MILMKLLNLMIRNLTVFTTEVSVNPILRDIKRLSRTLKMLKSKKNNRWKSTPIFHQMLASPMVLDAVLMLLETMKML